MEEALLASTISPIPHENLLAHPLFNPSQFTLHQI
jgi:hypothetical protein